MCKCRKDNKNIPWCFGSLHILKFGLMGIESRAMLVFATVQIQCRPPLAILEEGELLSSSLQQLIVIILDFWS